MKTNGLFLFSILVSFFSIDADARGQFSTTRQCPNGQWIDKGIACPAIQPAPQAPPPPPSAQAATRATSPGAASKAKAKNPPSEYTEDEANYDSVRESMRGRKESVDEQLPSEPGAKAPPSGDPDRVYLMERERTRQQFGDDGIPGVQDRDTSASDKCDCPEGTRCEAAQADNDSRYANQPVEVVKQFQDPSNKLFRVFCLRDKEPQAGNSQSAKTPDGSALMSCETEYQQLRDICLAKAKEAEGGCAEDNEAIQAAMDATKAIGIGSVAMNKACSKLAEISKMTNTALTGWQSVCAYQQRGCEQSCVQAEARFKACESMISPPLFSQVIEIGRQEDMPRIKEIMRTCASYKKRINEAAQHAATALVQLQASNKCQEDTKDKLTTNELDACKKDPTSPACSDQQKCSNADFAAKNPVCMCVNNPTSKDCLAINGGNPGSRNVAGLNPVGAVGKGNEPNGGDIQLPAPGGDPFGSSAFAGGNGGDAPNLGGQKGNAGLGGGGGNHGGGGPSSGGGGPGGNSGDPSDRTKVNSGFLGGNQALGGGVFGSRPGSGPGGGGRFGNGPSSSKLGAGAPFDPKRYLAGMNGKPGEYVSGPNASIFKIVKTRIEANRPSLLDPDFKK